ncbi:MAG: RND transporter [bacterium]
MKSIWIDKIPLLPLAALALLLAVAPVFPKSHLFQKLQMMFQGNLVQAIDIFDLFWHGTPLILLLIKMSRKWYPSNR